MNLETINLTFWINAPILHSFLIFSASAFFFFLFSYPEGRCTTTLARDGILKKVKVELKKLSFRWVRQFRCSKLKFLLLWEINSLFTRIQNIKGQVWQLFTEPLSSNNISKDLSPVITQTKNVVGYMIILLYEGENTTKHWSPRGRNMAGRATDARTRLRLVKSARDLKYECQMVYEIYSITVVLDT